MLTTLDYGAQMKGDIQNAITDAIRLGRTLTVLATPEMLDFAIGLSDGNEPGPDRSLDVFGATKTGTEWRLRISLM